MLKLFLVPGVLKMFRVFIKDVLVDEKYDIPFLKVWIKDSNDYFRIWVGKDEGTSIAEAICNNNPPRPNTHDTVVDILLQMGISLEKVVIKDLINGMFYADMILKQNGLTFIRDSKPSVAIAIGLRINAPIFVTEAVIGKIEVDSVNNTKKVIKNLNNVRNIMNERLICKIKPEDFV